MWFANVLPIFHVSKQKLYIGDMTSFVGLASDIMVLRLANQICRALEIPIIRLNVRNYSTYNIKNFPTFRSSELHHTSLSLSVTERSISDTRRLIGKVHVGNQDHPSKSPFREPDDTDTSESLRARMGQFMRCKHLLFKHKNAYAYSRKSPETLPQGCTDKYR